MEKKKAFSYSTYPVVRELAMQRAAKEGANMSLVIHNFLVGYGGFTEPGPTTGEAGEPSAKNAATTPKSSPAKSKAAPKKGKGPGRKN